VNEEALAHWGLLRQKQTRHKDMRGQLPFVIVITHTTC
jgi:hypothetical protein